MKQIVWGALLAMASCGGPEPNAESPAPYERYLGVRELGLRGDAEAVRRIVLLLDDRHALVVVGALEALADAGRKEFLQHVIPRTRHEHGLVRAAACRALGRLGNEEGLPALAAALGDPDPSVSRSAVRALAGFGRRPEVVGPLVEAVGAKEPSVALLAHETLQALTGRRDVDRSKEAWAQALP